MKRKNFIGVLKKFAESESKEIRDFIIRFELANPKMIRVRGKNNKKAYKIPKNFSKETYQKYLETPLWQGIRKRVLSAKGRSCEACGSRRKISVHHSIYETDILEGKSLRGLTVVCDACHKAIHNIKGATLMVATRMILQLNPLLSKEPLENELDIIRKMKKGLGKS